MKGQLIVPPHAFMLALTYALIACVAQEPPPSQPFSTERSIYISMVLSVSDGDTLSAVVNGAHDKIRLTGIDCPEKDYPIAKEAMPGAGFCSVAA